MSLFWLVLNVSFNHISEENSLISPTAPQEETLFRRTSQEGEQDPLVEQTHRQVHTPTSAWKYFCLPAKAMLRAGSWMWGAHTGRDTTTPGLEAGLTETEVWKQVSAASSPLEIAWFATFFLLIPLKKKVIQWQPTDLLKSCNFWTVEVSDFHDCHCVWICVWWHTSLYFDKL